MTHPAPQIPAGAPPGPPSPSGGFQQPGQAPAFGPGPAPAGPPGWAGPVTAGPVTAGHRAGWGPDPAAVGAPGQHPGLQQAAGQFPGGTGQPDGAPVPPGPRPSGSVNGALLCRLLALVATPLGLSIPFTASSLWVSTTAWAAFAMLAALLQAAPLLAGNLGWTAPRAWTVGAVGTAALLLFWLLVALPSVASNSGFTLTVAAAAAATGSLIAPGRRL